MVADEKNSWTRLLKELDEMRSRLNLPEEVDTRIKEARNAIVSFEKLNRSILDSLDANIAVIDENGTITSVNDSWIRFAVDNGVSSLDKVETGVNYFEVCRAAHGPHSREAPLALEGLRSLLSGARDHFQLEYPCDSPGARRWFLMKATRMDAGGRPCVVVSHIDITQRKIAEEALLRSKEDLEDQVRARTHDLERAKAEAELYLDIMSHDLSNINQALLGYLEVAQGRLQGIDERQMLARPLELVQKSSDLIARVKKLRECSSCEGRLECVDLGESVLDAVQRFGGFQEPRVKISYKPVQGLYVMANDLLPEIFINIVGNAIKHSDRCRELTINIDVNTISAGKKMCYAVAISDNGPGIPDALKAALFDPRPACRQKFPGRGVGMILVKNLIGMFNGAIQVKDRVQGDFHKGAVFIVKLPVAGP